MSEAPDVGEKLRPLEEGIGKQQIAMAMMHVFSIFGDKIRPSSDHRMMEYSGENCLAVAVGTNVTDFQLKCLRGEIRSFGPGYPHLGFFQIGELLYVAVPMTLVNCADERMVTGAMNEFGNYDADFKWHQEQCAAEEIIAALVADFRSLNLEIDIPEGGDAVDK